jgi:hypothetical protein
MMASGELTSSGRGFISAFFPVFSLILILSLIQ